MNHEQVKAEFMKNPEFKAEYDALEPFYEIQKQIIKLRLEQNMNQEQLAALLGTKQSAVSRLESGDSNPSIKILSEIARALGKKLVITMEDPSEPVRSA